MQDFNFCMKTENNLDDEGTLPWLCNMLNFDWASRDPAKIKAPGKYEKHDQLITEVSTQYLINALENYLIVNPESLAGVQSQQSAEEFVLEFLKSSKIEFYFQVNRSEDTSADDWLTYCRDMCSRLVLSLVIDRCEKECDPLGLRAIRRIMISYFLNRKNKVQDSKVQNIFYLK
jgi:hypothetical protein